MSSENLHNIIITLYDEVYSIKKIILKKAIQMWKLAELFPHRSKQSQ